MSFIRAKEIPPHSGNWYDYEVMNTRTGNKVRQKVIRYLGRSSGRHAPGSGGGGNAGPLPVIVSGATGMPPTNDARITKMKTPAKQIASAMSMYYGGMSLDAIQQQFKQDHNLDMSESR